MSANKRQRTTEQPDIGVAIACAAASAVHARCDYCRSTACYTIDCPNRPMCGEALPRCIAQCHGGKCGICAAGGLSFEFVEPNDDCCICYERDALQVRLRCGHRVCTTCFRKPMDAYDCTTEPSPQDFGCPEFSAHASEDEKEAVMDAWAEREPEHKEYWDAACLQCEEEHTEQQERTREVLAKCPLCRETTQWHR